MSEITPQSSTSKKVGKGAIGVGVGLLAAVLASLCCVGPLAVGLLGLGALAAFLSRYSIAFTVAAGVLLVAGVWLLLRRRGGGSGDGGACCRIDGGGTSSRAVLLMLAAFAALWTAARYAVVPALARYATQAGPAAVAAHHPGARTLTLDIRGMDCAGCVGGITAVLKSRPGIRSAHISYPQGRGTVTYDPTRILPAAIVKTLQGMGYRVRILQDEAPGGSAGSGARS